MTTVTLRIAKESLAELIERAEAGEDIVIVRRGRPVARLVPFAHKASQSKGFGSMKGRVEIGPEFFEPLPDEEIEAWYR